MRGRPQGTFTQHRRVEDLRRILTTTTSGMTLEEMARQLRVSTRTVRRYLREMEREFDLEQLPTDGLQLRWRVRPGEIPRKVSLRRTQAYALLAARHLFAPMRGSALHEEVDIAVNSIMALAQKPGRGPNAGAGYERLEERFLYLPFAPKDYSNKTEELDDLFQAVADLRPLHLRYRSLSKAEFEQITIHPYAMVMHRDSIYCVGWHTGRNEIRTFVLDRMKDTDFSTDERFDLPADFHIDDYFQGEFGVWRSDEKHRVVIDFDEQAAASIRMRKAHLSQKLSNLPGGGVRLTMEVGSLIPVKTWVLEWGARARVVEPPSLVAEVRAELLAAVGRYDESAPPRPAGKKK